MSGDEQCRMKKDRKAEYPPHTQGVAEYGLEDPKDNEGETRIWPGSKVGVAEITPSLADEDSAVAQIFRLSKREFEGILYNMRNLGIAELVIHLNRRKSPVLAGWKIWTEEEPPSNFSLQILSEVESGETKNG